MPASNIKSIEVITNPGAQYDAEGAGGVLCITTKKGGAKKMVFDEEESEGSTNGSIHATGGTKTWGLHSSLTSQHGRWTYDMNMNAEYMYSPNTGHHYWHNLQLRNQASEH